MATKFTHEFAKEYFNNYKYTLLDGYKNARVPMKYLCDKGHECFGNFDNFRRGKRCKLCRNNELSIARQGAGNPSWNPDRELVKNNKRIHSLCKKLIHRCFDLSNQIKNTKTEELLGYNRKELLEHLQNDPNFDNWKKDSYNWHIDHIFPVKILIEYGITDPKIINALDNLQILSAMDNMSKHDKCDIPALLNYIKSKL